MKILSLVAIVAAALLIATLFSGAFERMQLDTAERWYGRGLKALESGRASDAVPDLETAILHDRDNRDYLMSLATALAQSGRQAQAQAYYLGLWQSEPGYGELNLQLARIAAEQHNIPEAQQYFHGAIFGTWPDQPVVHRSQARRELIEFLLGANKKQQAEPEILALSAEAPQDPGVQAEVGGMLLRAGDQRLALQSFQQALRLGPNDHDATVDAAKTAFNLGEFALARHYLERAVKLAPADSTSRDLLKSVLLVQSVDPFDPKLRYSEGMSRVIHDFELAGARLKSCAAEKNIDLNPSAQKTAPQPTAAAPTQIPLQVLLSDWESLHPNITKRGLLQNPDQMDVAVDLAFNIERETNTLCGPPAGEDLALLTIAQHRANP